MLQQQQQQQCFVMTLNILIKSIDGIKDQYKFIVIDSWITKQQWLNVLITLVTVAAALDLVSRLWLEREDNLL